MIFKVKYLKTLFFSNFMEIKFLSLNEEKKILAQFPNARISVKKFENILSEEKKNL